MFASLETMVLRDRGALNLDDPVSKYIPELEYKSQKHSPAAKEEVTIRQLMSHMAGFFRQLASGPPPERWPEPLPSLESLHSITPHPNNSKEAIPAQFARELSDVLRQLSTHRLIMSPYKMPSYSNIGFSLLGEAALSAARSREGHLAPTSYPALMKRDIFDKLNMSDSSFLADESNKDRVVVPSKHHLEVDGDFGAGNPSGGQMSSLSDLIKAAQSFLDPTSESALLPPTTMMEWLRPVYSFGDDITSVGLPWEITRTKLTFGRSVDEFTKLGALSSMFSSFTLIPSHSFAVVVLTASEQNVATELHRLAMDYFLPAVDHALMQAMEEHISGIWKSDEKDRDQVELQVLVEAGRLVATRYTVNGTDALMSLNHGMETNRMPIWSAGNDELRLVPAMPGLGSSDCFAGWLTFDDSVYLNGYAVNMLRTLPHGSDPMKNRLEVPALQVTLTRE